MAIVCHEVMRHGIRVLTGFRRNAHLSGSKDDRLRPADCKSLAGALFKMRALPCRLADGPPRIPAACIPARPHCAQGEVKAALESWSVEVGG